MNILDYTLDKYFDGECGLLDAHCHMKQTQDFKLICFGLVPSGFEVDKQFESEDVQVGLGFHPWAVESADADEVKAFENQVDDAKFIGEIGLDFSSKHLASKDKQLEVFSNICDLLSKTKGKVISIHAVKSATEVMDILQKTGADKGNIVILHWFSGTSDELKRAIDAGYYFSVGPKMHATNKGFEYIRQIPESRMFIETDLPWDGEGVTPEEHLNLLNDFVMQLR